MRNIITFLITLITSTLFAQDLIFEQIDGTDTTFGTVDVYQTDYDSFSSGIYENTNFDKSLGWHLSAVDGTNYYYQITDTLSEDYGAIAYWDAVTEQVVDYGDMSDIFETPTNWFLGGADDGILYFASNDTDSQIVSWDGTSLTEVNYMSDMVVAIQNWRFCGYHEGIIYLQWIRLVNQPINAKGWDGSSFINTFNFNDFYTLHTDANIVGVSNYISTDDSEIFEALEQVKNYINGEITLSTEDFTTIHDVVLNNLSFFETSYNVIELAQEVIALHDAEYGALFTTGTTTEGGYLRTATGYEFENMILEIMQSVLNHSYTESNLETYPELFNNVLFETSSFFPGSADIPENETISYTLPVNITHVQSSGSQDNYYLMDARRPTGCYVAPGSIVKVTVPDEMVGIGAKVLVGCHTWSFSVKPDILRMDEVIKRYEINDNEVTVANPLGGLIYIDVPLGIDLGATDITFTNVIRSPYYADNAITSTTLDEWQNTERLHPAPWADFETERTMFQVPTSWIYAWDDPTEALQDWDDAMDAISEIHGRDLIRAKTAQYMQIDLQIRSAQYSPGYPMTNHPYDPYDTHEDGYNSTHSFLQGPTAYVSNVDVLYHEMGHGEKIPKFTGEIESYVNFLWVAVQNRKFGVDLDQALAYSRNYSQRHTIADAAVSWMIADNFRDQAPMSSQTGNYQQEFHYQYRGHAKYVEIVRLFDWDPIINFFESVSEDYENGITYAPNNDPTDNRLLRMSEAAGYDLRPLIHFWGVHPLDAATLDTQIEALGVEKSTAIYDVLNYYKTLVPMSNDEFKTWVYGDYTEAQILAATCENGEYETKSYGPEMISCMWDLYDETYGADAVEFIDYLIDLYFPDGRPETDNDSCYEIDILSAEASSYEADSTNDADNAIDGDASTRWAASGDGEYIIFDLGEEYSICDMQLDFYENASRNYTFDVEVSRDNLTYAPVFQSITNSTTTDLFDDYVLSRNARYVKITGYGNTTNDWNAIEEFKLYTTEDTLSNDIFDVVANDDVTLYPVPAKNVMSISGLSNNEADLEIYDISGALITSFTSDISEIDTSFLPNGVYFIKIFRSGVENVKKFIVKK